MPFRRNYNWTPNALPNIPPYSAAWDKMLNLHAKRQKGELVRGPIARLMNFTMPTPGTTILIDLKTSDDRGINVVPERVLLTRGSTVPAGASITFEVRQTNGTTELFNTVDPTELNGTSKLIEVSPRYPEPPGGGFDMPDYAKGHNRMWAPFDSDRADDFTQFSMTSTSLTSYDLNIVVIGYYRTEEGIFADD
jgi:hypothetical protein